jgi:hypothetical protein
MSYVKFKLPTVASVATVAAPCTETRLLAGAEACPQAVNPTHNTVKIKLVSYSNAISSGYALKEETFRGGSKKLVLLSGAATVATAATLRAGLAAFKERRPYSVTRFRHDQACWAAEVFLAEWKELVIAFEWQVEDIFGRGGLAWWLGVELVTALGPEHAVAEVGRVFDRASQDHCLPHS